MRRLFLLIITGSQFFGALFALAHFDSIAAGAPASAGGLVQNLAAGVTTLIYLLGLLGSILIWTGARTGLWLSVFHQLLIIPVFFIPGVFYWVAGDVVSAVTAAVLHGNGDLTFGASLSFNSASPLTAFKAAADASYFGVDLFALICVAYLNRLRRDEI